MKSLDGRRILVTRAEADAPELARLLHERGAEAVTAPTIEFLPPEDTLPLDEALREAAAGAFDWIVFATPRAVEAVRHRFDAIHLPVQIAGMLAGVGPSTVEAMRAVGLSPDLMPDEDYSSVGLAAAFPDGEGRVLLPRADIAPADLEEALIEKGWKPVRVTAYLTRHPAALPDRAKELLDEGRIDAVVFTSASTARGFARMAGKPAKPKYVCIGPATARQARESGFLVDAVAEPHTIEGLVKALEDVFATL